MNEIEAPNPAKAKKPRKNAKTEPRVARKRAEIRTDSFGHHHQIGIRGSLENPRKPLILEDAKDAILQGETLQVIADRNDISVETLKIWLAQLGDEYKTLRDIWIDAKLIRAENNVETSEDQLHLSRARETLRHAQWVAERRDKRYMNTQQVTTVTLNLTAAIEAGRARAGITIDQETEAVR